MTTTPADIAAAIRTQNVVFVSTQTHRMHGELCELVVLNQQGRTLIDTFIKPQFEIDASTSAYHGITNEMVADSPTFPDVHGETLAALEGKIVLAYGADYARSALFRTCFNYDLPKPKPPVWFCIMQGFATFYGDLNPQYNSYSYKKLTEAAAFFDIEISQERAGLGKALAARLVATCMAETVEKAARERLEMNMWLRGKAADIDI